MSEPSLFDFKKATVKIKDGTAVTPLEIEVILGEGTMSYTETNEYEYRRSRGKLSKVKEGDEQPVELTIQADLISVTGITGGTPTIMEALKKKGLASAWVSTGGNCEPYSVDIEVVLDYDTDCPGTHGETFVFPEFRSTSRAVNFTDATIDIQGSCNVTTIESTRQDPA